MVYGEVFNFLFSFQFFILIKILFSSNAGQRGEVECQRFIIIANSTFELVRDGHLLKQRKVQNNVQCATNQAAQRKICVCVFGIRLSCFLFHLHTPTPTSHTHTHTHSLLVQEKNVSENIHRKLITCLFHRKTWFLRENFSPHTFCVFCIFIL